MKKVVVTGGAGFIGSHLCYELAERGFEVIIIDDLSSGKWDNIQPLLDRDKVKFLEGNVLDLSLVSDTFRGVEYVFHQAAVPSVPMSIKNPLASHNANTTGTLNVLVAARDAGVRKVVYASSCSVFGDTPTIPQKEDTPPKPQSPYAVTKLTGEYYCQVFQEIYGLATICLRYFNVYGPRQDPESEYAAVIPKFIKRASEGMALTIFGDGEQTRDFVFIKDVVEANILAAESQAIGIYNIGGGNSITINELANEVLNIVGSNIMPVYEEPRTGDVQHSYADIAKAKTFGYAPKYILEEGLKETVKLFGL